MNTNKYNGWTNYETWLVGLWFNNDSSEYWAERAQEVFNDAEADDTFTRKENASFALRDEMKDSVEEFSPAGVTGMYADLLNASLSEVNFQEIAEHFLDEVEEEESAA